MFKTPERLFLSSADELLFLKDVPTLLGYLMGFPPNAFDSLPKPWVLDRNGVSKEFWT